MNKWTGKARNMSEWLESLKQQREIMDNVTEWRTIPPRDAVYAPLPEGLHPELLKALHAKGMDQLYSHQAAAFSAAQIGEHVVTVTPTASGKALCYNLPVLQEIVSHPESRALYMFPTKMLAQDQVAEVQQFVDLVDSELKTHTYDGDTAPSIRTAIRIAGHIVVTNPDMLNSAILPHHTKWVKLFENYGSNPQFLCASATIDNPGEHASRLIGKLVLVVDNNGAPAGEKRFIYYNQSERCIPGLSCPFFM